MFSHRAFQDSDPTLAVYSKGPLTFASSQGVGMMTCQHSKLLSLDHNKILSQQQHDNDFDDHSFAITYSQANSYRGLVDRRKVHSQEEATRFNGKRGEGHRISTMVHTGIHPAKAQMMLFSMMANSPSLNQVMLPPTPFLTPIGSRETFLDSIVNEQYSQKNNTGYGGATIGNSYQPYTPYIACPSSPSPNFFKDLLTR
ncbi:hypothetical protein BGZ51_002151 [Haplosporangium sp. Z 767]|nr:hypothetical protein BGZ51_002151 [Haplosporangium sp. Z 767]KAF9195206.1 hypothetical protein BGZ50_005040 [Haplosporangium sp. Z 11]